MKNPMSFDPITRQLFTSGGELIKQLECKFYVRWEDMTDEQDSLAGKCTICTRAVFDTALHTEDELVALLRNDPATCLKVDLNQHNLIILAHGFLD